MSEKKLSLDEVEQLAQAALVGVGATQANARPVACSTRLAERDGIRSHGLMYVPVYAEHVRCGKVDGRAQPQVEQPASGSIVVNAKHGFAHPAIDAGWDLFIHAARENGVSVLTVHQSYNCGVLGHHSKRIAEAGLIGLCFTHAPASIAPSGGHQPVIGTNPFAVSIPDGIGGVALSIDQSASAVAKSEIMLRAREGRDIETGWALDAEGKPTTDAQAALKGTMLPSGGYKGFGTGLLVELLASCLSGALLSKDASPFAGTAGGPPATGQCFLAFSPDKFSGDVFFDRVSDLVAAIRAQEGAHVPGDKAKNAQKTTESEGIWVDETLLQRIQAFCPTN